MAIEFWFEFASTYSYPAAMRIEGLARARSVDLVWRPFLLGPIFRDQGWADSPFNLFPAKGRYMWRDLERICDGAGLAMRRPTAFPRNGLLAARVICAHVDAPWIPDFVRAVYSANFADDREIGDRAVLADLLGALELDADETLARADGEPAKARLRQNTESARALGIFGAPSFVVGGELFWGNDRLEMALDHALRHESGPPSA